MLASADSDRVVRAQCYDALARGLRRVRPDVVLDAKGYVQKPEDNSF
jgi:hypothetical protein